MKNHSAGGVLRPEREQLLDDLRFLIEAIDRRLPHLDRLGESQIVADAAELRLRAVNLIEKMESSDSD